MGRPYWLCCTSRSWPLAVVATSGSGVSSLPTPTPFSYGLLPPPGADSAQAAHPVPAARWLALCRATSWYAGFSRRVVAAVSPAPTHPDKARGHAQAGRREAAQRPGALARAPAHAGPDYHRRRLPHGPPNHARQRRRDHEHLQPDGQADELLLQKCPGR
nr:hypothetical protein [Tanacetum cinerariifolium]